jgi:hypothetical protein
MIPGPPQAACRNDAEWGEASAPQQRAGPVFSISLPTRKLSENFANSRAAWRALAPISAAVSWLYAQFLLHAEQRILGLEQGIHLSEQRY